MPTALDFGADLDRMTVATTDLTVAMRREHELRRDLLIAREAHVAEHIGEPNPQTGKPHTRNSLSEQFDGSPEADEITGAVLAAQVAALRARCAYRVAELAAEYAICG